MAVNWTTVEDRIRAWVKSASGFTDAQIIWSEQTGARPAGSFITLKIIGPIVALGAYDELELNSDGAQATVTAMREFRLSVQAFSASVTGANAARAVLGKVQAALMLPTIRNAFPLAGVTPFDPGQVVDLTALVGAAFESRAALDVGFYLLDGASESATYIEQVEVTNEEYYAEAPPADDSARFMWRLDEEGGTDDAEDEVGDYPLPSVSGTPVVVAGTSGNARDFNGNSYLYGAADAATVSKVQARNWTLMFRIKMPAAVVGYRGIVGLTDAANGLGNWPLTVFINNQEWFVGDIYRVGGSSANYVNKLIPWTVNTWHHFAVTYRPGSNGLEWFFNGTSQGTSNFNLDSIPAGAAPHWWLGTSWNSNNYLGVDAAIDDVTFVDRVLTADEIVGASRVFVYQPGGKFLIPPE